MDPEVAADLALCAGSGEAIEAPLHRRPVEPELAEQLRQLWLRHGSRDAGGPELRLLASLELELTRNDHVRQESTTSMLSLATGSSS